MTPTRLARLTAGRLHYAWVVLGLIFVSMLAGVSVRAAPGVMIGPLRRAFGWDIGTISGAISVNIMLMGLVAPFMAGLMQSLGLKRTMISALCVLMGGTGLSLFMTAPWQLFLTWGVMVGIGAGAGAVGFAGAVANRWFLKRTGFASGLLFAANAAGQLVFLPLFAWLAELYGWRAVAAGATVAIASVIPLLLFLFPESPAAIGVPPYGGTEVVSESQFRSPGGDMVSVTLRALWRAAKSADFWLLCVSFGVCGLSTNGLINTHLIAYCLDEGIPEMRGASILAAVGLFSLFGSMASGWLCDRYSPRVLLFWYYSLRGLSLVLIPFSAFDGASLSVFAVFYGLDWVATGPATFALTNEVFGRRDAPVIVSWIFLAHQVGGSIAAYGAGAVRSASGSYLLAFLASGLACLAASLLVLRITPRGRLAVAAE
jgi:MFS family permease